MADLQKIISWAKNDDLLCICNLLAVNYDIVEQINNFNPICWRNQSADSLSNIPFLSCKEFSELGISGSVFDSLYIREKRNKGNNDENDNNDMLLYLTPHLIFTHYNKGESNVNFFQEGSILPEEVTTIAIYTNSTPRTYDNRSLEIYQAKSDNRITSLGLLTERRRGQNKEMEIADLKYAFIQLLDNIKIFFNKYLYIPYLIHPYRLIFFENDKVLRLVSGNILQYIFVPHCSSRKIKDPLFSHPLSFFPSTRIRNTIDINIIMFEMMLTLLLDFFHSSFITILWLVTHDINVTKNRIILNRNVRTVGSKLQLRKRLNNHKKNGERSMGKGLLFWDKINNNTPFTTTTNNNTTTTTTNNNNNSNNNNNKNKNDYNDVFWKPDMASFSCTTNKTFICNNPYGFCSCFSECSNDIQLLIHNYGCTHIMSILPDILQKSIESETMEDIRKTIEDEITLLKKFSSKLLNIEG